MQKAIIGKKVGMTQIFDENGHVIPVTVIEAGPCVVAQKKTIENDGYVSVQLAYGEVAEKKLSKPELGHLKKAGISARKHLKEFKLDNAAELEVGAEIKVDTFAAGDHVDVTGISKGHGHPGVIKRSKAASAPRRPTAAARSTVMQVPWAPPPILPVSSRVRSAQARWALSRSPCRTSTSSRSTRT